MKILYFDTETIGFNPPAIVQLGFIVDKDKVKESEGNFLFNPGMKINPQAAKIHGLSDKMVKDEPKFSSYLPTFIQITKDVDYICGHNVQFDFKALFFEADRAYIKASDEQKKEIEKWKTMCKDKSVCTMNHSIDLCKIPGRYGRNKWPKLSELHIHLFNEDFEGAHDAMADIIATRRCFLEMDKMGVIKL